LYAQSLAAATASNFTLPGSFGSLGLGVCGNGDGDGGTGIGAPTEEPTQHQKVVESKSQHKSRKVSASTSTAAREHTPVHSESHRSSHKYAEPGHRHVAVETKRHSSYLAPEPHRTEQDQSEPEDLSVPSTKRRETSVVTDLSARRPSSRNESVRNSSRLASAAPAVEDLSGKPSTAAVILAVPDSRSTTASSQGQSSPSPAKSSMVIAKDVSHGDAPMTTPSKTPGRSRSRLIDSISTKLMAQKQMVNADDGETLSRTAPAAVPTACSSEPPVTCQMQQLTTVTKPDDDAPSSSVADSRTVVDSFIVATPDEAATALADVSEPAEAPSSAAAAETDDSTLAAES
jgi:hypothetical protein